MFDFEMLSYFDSNCVLVANGSWGLKNNVHINCGASQCWRQGFRHPTRNQYIGWFAQIESPPPYQPLLEQTVTFNAYNSHQLFKNIQIIYVVEPNRIIGLVPSFRKGSMPTNFCITNLSFFLLQNTHSPQFMFYANAPTTIAKLPYVDIGTTLKSNMAYSGAPVLLISVVV